MRVNHAGQRSGAQLQLIICILAVESRIATMLGKEIPDPAIKIYSRENLEFPLFSTYIFHLPQYFPDFNFKPSVHLLESLIKIQKANKLLM